MFSAFQSISMYQQLGSGNGMRLNVYFSGHSYEPCMTPFWSDLAMESLWRVDRKGYPLPQKIREFCLFSCRVRASALAQYDTGGYSTAQPTELIFFSFLFDFDFVSVLLQWKKVTPNSFCVPEAASPLRPGASYLHLHMSRETHTHQNPDHTRPTMPCHATPRHANALTRSGRKHL